MTEPEKKPLKPPPSITETLGKSPGFGELVEQMWTIGRAKEAQAKRREEWRKQNPPKRNP